MKKETFIALGCVGLVTMEAYEFGVTGEKPKPPASQPHIHAPTGNVSASAYQAPIFTLTSTNSTGISGNWVPLPMPQSAAGGPPVIIFPPVRGSLT